MKSRPSGQPFVVTRRFFCIVNSYKMENLYAIERLIVMKEYELKYGCNPNQKPARIFMKENELPIQILNGRPGYINLLDALNAWQLVVELKQATGLAAATSFKHVSPAGAAVGLPLSFIERKIYWIEEDMQLSKIANAYARARGADRMSSYGDFIALSDTCDLACAQIIQNEFSDGIIAPSFDPEALEILKKKKKGSYCILQIDPNYVPEKLEHKEVFGITFEQGRNELQITADLFENLVTKNKNMTSQAIMDLMIATITLKYTQSNSVCYAKGGQAIGIGAGQQSRIHCTRLAGQKADNWYLRQNPKVLSLDFKKEIKRAERDNCIDVYISDEYMDILSDGSWEYFFNTKPEIFTREERKEWASMQKDVSLASDAFFPFGDNIMRAKKSGVKYIAQPGGSIRDDHVIGTCDDFDMVMSFTGIRLFHH